MDRRRRGVAACGFGAVLSLVAVVSCTGDPVGAGSKLYTDAGIQQVNPEPDATVGNASGQTLKPFSLPADPGANGVYVTISGESNAQSGYPFPPKDWGNDTYMYDGWQFVIERYIVVVDHLNLWSSPNTDPTNQSKHGALVAHADGPFVVDLHKSGSAPQYLTGQGGAPEVATPLAAITSQNDNGGGGFDSSTTYAFGFSTVPASYVATGGEPGPFNVNLDGSEAADFDYMVAHGYSVLYVGTAQWVGDQSPYGCVQTSVTSSSGSDAGASAEAGTGGYDFTRLPPRVNFRFGFSTPTNYVNCQNMTLQGRPVGNDDYPRGIQVSPSQSAIAQVTLHMDHPFWESFAENTPVHFDPIAAQYVGAQGTPTAQLEDMVGVPFYAFTDKTGAPLPWRNCSGTHYTPPNNGQMAFNTVNVPVDPHGTCVAGSCPGIRDYYDFMRYTQSTQGHLNSQGLCFVDRQFPAPAGGS